jgi:hypothetical protein
MDLADELRELAVWYREQAERAGNPVIWDSRLTTPEKPENEAALLEAATCFAPLGAMPVTSV